jgi:Fur family zinc uptake transcriptional regulator
MSETRADLTRNQKLVLSALRDGAQPLSAYQLLDRLRPHKVTAPPTVYRALDKLMERGLVHRIETANTFVACAHGPHEEDMALRVCRSCGAADEVPLGDLLDALKGRAGRDGFALDRLTLEIEGLCGACREADARA